MEPTLGSFDVAVDIDVPSRGSTFHVYIASASKCPLGTILMIHGAGCTGMSWSPLVSTLKELYCCVAPDMRGHGSTVAADEDELSAATLVEDMVAVVSALFGESRTLAIGGNAVPQILVVGHSLGGSIAIRLMARVTTHAISTETIHNDTHGADCMNALTISNSSATTTCSDTSVLNSVTSTVSSRNTKSVSTVNPVSTGETSTLPTYVNADTVSTSSVSISMENTTSPISTAHASAPPAPVYTGVVCIDMVEGTALASVPHMAEVLSGIPSSFENIQAAVNWHLKTGSIRSVAAAQVTVPSRFVLKEGSASAGEVVWRTNLLKSEKYWLGWFTGLSRLFLDLQVPKLLIVAGMDRLDTELTVGQIQGKYQLKFVYGASHSIHEDQPLEVANCVCKFIGHFGLLPGSATGKFLGDKDELAERLARARKNMPH